MKHNLKFDKIKNTIGATNITLSSRSSTPPWPGIIFPLSFTPAKRLNLDSIKSPVVPKHLRLRQ
jgi:hypothetical protein